MTVPQPTEDIGQLYDKTAKSYERAFLLPNLLYLNRIRQELFAKASGKILEIGVGSGKNLEYFPAGCEVVGIDLSTAMLELAAMRAKTLGIEARFIMMDAEHLDFPDGTFDTVVSSLSLCIFPDPVHVLKELARVCRPEGRIIMLEHGRSTNARLAHFQDQRADMFINAVGCHWNRDVVAIVRDAGLTMVRDQQRLLGMLHTLEMMPAQPQGTWQGVDESDTMREVAPVEPAETTLDK